jgi:hypothetical protein
MGSDSECESPEDESGSDEESSSKDENVFSVSVVLI